MHTTMRAVVWTDYGPPEVLILKDVEKPVPGENEILVRIIAANIFPGDCELRRFQMDPLFWLPLRLYIGLFKPRVKILGQEFAGIVESVGSAVTAFKPGDEVFSPTTIGGGYAEYVCVKDKIISLKPHNMSYEEAATVPVGGLNALHFLRCANIQPGQKVLLYGTAGSIGTWAVQIAKAFGAEVTAVDSTLKLDKLRELGADHVIDYTKEDFTENGVVYDAIVDVVGKTSYSRTLRSIKPGGYYILDNHTGMTMIRSLWSRWTTHCHVSTALTGYKRENLLYLKQLIEAGNLRAIIDRRYPLEQVVAAHHFIDTGAKIGHVVLTVAKAP